MKKQTLTGLKKELKEAQDKNLIIKETAEKILFLMSHHLNECHIQTGEITAEDLDYCENLGKRVINHVFSK
jgi:hypothetical protein